MEQAIQLFGFLILTILGLIVPIMAILLSLFQEGISKLAAQYESEKSQSENNIKEQLKKMAEAQDIDESAIKQSIRELESIKKTAETKLSYLNPRKQIVRLFVPLTLAFLGVLVTSLLVGTNIYYCFFLLVGLVGFTYAIVVLWKLIGIIIEVRKIVDTDRKDMDSRTIELLSALVEEVKKTGQYYLQSVYVSLDGKDIKDDSRIITVQVNSKQELKLGIQNHESRMAKNIEIGLIFPTNFIIEKSNNYSVYRDQKQQIVRFEENLVHGNTHLYPLPLSITPLEQGDYRIRTFIKAENIEATYRNFTAKVT